MRDPRIGDVEVFEIDAPDFDDNDNVIDGPWGIEALDPDTAPWWICDTGALVCDAHAREIPRREREPLHPELAGLLEEHEHGDLLICHLCGDATDRYGEIVHALTREIADAHADREVA